MGVVLKIDFSFKQVMALVKQLSIKEKIKLAKELKKEGIESKFLQLLN